MIEKECSALGGLFQTIISDMKVRVCAVGVGAAEGKPLPTWPGETLHREMQPQRGRRDLPPHPGLGLLLRGTLPRVRAADPAGGSSLAEREASQMAHPRGLGLRVARRTPPLPPSLLARSLSCSNMQAVISHRGQRFPNPSPFFTLFFPSISPSPLFGAAGSLAECRQRGGGDGHGARQPRGGAGKGRVGVAEPCWWARWKDKKTPQPGDAPESMRAWAKIAARSVRRCYFHAVCSGRWRSPPAVARMAAKVPSGRVSPLPAPSNAGGFLRPPLLPEGPLPLERRSPSTLDSQGHFCGVFSGQAGASRPSLVGINRDKWWLRCARRARPQPGLRCPAPGTGPTAGYCSVPWARAARPPARAAGEDALVGRCGGTCQITGEPRSFQGSSRGAGLLPAGGTGFLWVFQSMMSREGCGRKNRQVVVKEEGICSRREPGGVDGF